MSDFAETWRLVRGRFDAAILDLNPAQLNWRLHPDSLTLGEMALHVAGVEIWFLAQLDGRALEGEEARIAATATDGVVNDKPFPFSAEEVTPERVRAALEAARAQIDPAISSPDPYRAKQIVSALGPLIDGTGAFARIAYHPGYHQGQAHTIRSAPGFPG